MSLRCEVEICVPATHPALRGHFPGAPVVPGVLLLECLLEAAEAQLGAPLCIRGLPHAKFLAPLKPEQRALGVLEARGTALTFRVELDGQPIASGAFLLRDAVELPRASSG